VFGVEKGEEKEKGKEEEITRGEKRKD
jgi:hypothetical protein